MATREELYAKFGVTAEAAQLFETELGTLLLCLRSLEHGWHLAADGERARAAFDEIDQSTLGRLLAIVKKHVVLEDDLEIRFSSALRARNRLTHGFYERHNFKIQTVAGRAAMIEDLEGLHDELFTAWQLAGAMTTIMSEIVLDQRLQNREEAKGATQTDGR